MILDHFAQAKLDAQKAVRTFLPSLAQKVPIGPKVAQPAPQLPPRQLEAVRAASLARHVEGMSARVARGLPPTQPQPTPEQQFGPELDPVHIRAISSAIAAHPETQRATLLHEAHESLVRWIASHNGKVVVDGHMELAHTPQTAETLAAKIINGAVDEHDQRQQANQEASLAGGTPRDKEAPEARNPSSRRVVGNQPGGTDKTRPTAPARNGNEGARPPVPVNATRDSGNPLPAGPAATGAPEVVPPGDGQPPAQGAPPEVTPQEVQQVGTRAQDGHLRTQPKNSVPANQKLALEAAPQLDGMLKELSATVPGTRYDRIRPQKATDRLGEKVEDDNQPNTLSDYLGAQIAADSPQAKDALIDLLRKNFKVIEVEDKFLEGRDDKAGYPSANVQVQMGNGLSAEVQIVPKEVQDRTEESHAYYKKGRDAEANGDNEERDRQWAKAKAIHDEALTAFKTRNGLASDSAPGTPAQPNRNPAPQVAGYEALGEPIQLGSHTFLRVRPAGSTPATPSDSET